MSKQSKEVLGYEAAFITSDDPEHVLSNLRGVSCLLMMMGASDIGNHKNIAEAYEVLAHIVDASTVRLSQARDV